MVFIANAGRGVKVNLLNPLCYVTKKKFTADHNLKIIPESNS